MKLISHPVPIPQQRRHSAQPITFTRPNSVRITSQSFRTYSPFRISVNNPSPVHFTQNSPIIITQSRPSNHFHFPENNIPVKENAPYFHGRSVLSKTMGAGFKAFDYVPAYEVAERKEIVIPVKHQIERQPLNQEYYAQLQPPVTMGPYQQLQRVHRNSHPVNVQRQQKQQQNDSIKESSLDTSIINKLDETPSCASIKPSNAIQNSQKPRVPLPMKR